MIFGLSKTSFFAFLPAAAVLVILACGGEPEAISTQPPASTATPTPVPIPASTATVVPTIQVPPTPASTAALSPTVTPAPTTMTVPATATLAPSPTPIATEGDLFLQLVEPADTEIFTNEPSLHVVGRTRVDAVITVNDTIVEPDIDGQFLLTIDLEEGPNIIEVVASVASGEQLDLVLVVFYLP